MGTMLGKVVVWVHPIENAHVRLRIRLLDWLLPFPQVAKSQVSLRRFGLLFILRFLSCGLYALDWNSQI